MSKIFLVTPNEDANGLVKMIPHTVDLQVFTENELAKSDIRFDANDKVCILSETSLALVKSRLNDNSQIKAVELLKDKYEFRKILSKIYPNYFFQTVGIDEIQNLQVDKKCVIKPQKGFFGTAVLEIDKTTDMQKIKNQIESEVNKNSSLFPEEMLSSKSFLVEQFIEGEEYAVDMFYNDKGEAVIVNLYHHPMPKHPEYLQMLYYSSKKVFDEINAKSVHFFEELNNILQVKNIALHAEFRLKNNDYIPIEINPMRYGGMALGTMVYYGLNVNPYQTFANNEKPNWNTIWNKTENKEAVYAYMIAYNGKTADVRNKKPDIERFKKEFTQVLKSNVYPFENQLTFGTFVLKETEGNLRHILQLDFDDFFA